MRTVWLLVERFRLVVVICALSAPFVGTWLGAWIRRRVQTQRPQLGAAALGLGISAGTLLLPVLLFMAMCSPPPGRGRASEAWYASAQPAIDALERFHVERQSYPDSLATLVPRYMSRTQLSQIQRTTGEPLAYTKTGPDYEVIFRYYGPGSNNCTFRSSDPRWRCRGSF